MCSTNMLVNIDDTVMNDINNAQWDLQERWIDYNIVSFIAGVVMLWLTLMSDISWQWLIIPAFGNTLFTLGSHCWKKLVGFPILVILQWAFAFGVTYLTYTFINLMTTAPFQGSSAMQVIVFATFCVGAANVVSSTMRDMHSRPKPRVLRVKVEYRSR
jgi:hypothetical protein